MHFPCLGQENVLVVGREKPFGNNEDMRDSCMEIYRTLTTIQPSWHPPMIYKASMGACWGAKRARIRPTRRDSNGGRSGECL